MDHLLTTSLIRCGVLVCTIFLALTCSKTWAQDQNATLLVLYPDVRAPYSKVFDEIIAGLDATYEGPIKTLKVGKGFDLNKTRDRISESQTSAILGLGSSGLEAARSLDSGLPVYAGAVVKNGDVEAGISMIPDLNVLADTFLALNSRIKQVHVVAPPNYMNDFLALGDTVFNSKGMSLKLHISDSYQTAAIAYRDILREITDQEAIWLIPGSPYLDNSVLSLILQVAWDKNAILASSNPSHIARGALFALYPDNTAMGRSLGSLITQNLLIPQKTGLQPLRDVTIGVNMRTANHLGIYLDTDNLAGFQLVKFSR